MQGSSSEHGERKLLGGDFLLPSSLEDHVLCSTEYLRADAGDVTVQDLILVSTEHPHLQRGAG